VAVQNDGAVAQPDLDTAAEPLNLPARLSRRQSKTPTPTMNHSGPLRFAVLRLPLRSWLLLCFPLCSSPFCRYSFSLLYPSPPPFHHSPKSVSSKTVLLLFYCFEPYTIDYIALLYVFCLLLKLEMKVFFNLLVLKNSLVSCSALRSLLMKMQNGSFFELLCFVTSTNQLLLSTLTTYNNVSIRKHAWMKLITGFLVDHGSRE